jgi:hypothetical protein
MIAGKKVVLDANGHILGYLARPADKEEVTVFNARGREIANVRSEFAGRWLLQTLAFDGQIVLSRRLH